MTDSPSSSKNAPEDAAKAQTLASGQSAAAAPAAAAPAPAGAAPKPERTLASSVAAAASPTAAEVDAHQPRRESDLSHFYEVNARRSEQPTNRQDFADKVSEAMGVLREQGSAGLSGGKKLGGKLAALRTRVSKKMLMVAAAAAAAALLAAIIAPSIPLQFQRSAGFAALQQQDYTTALDKLKGYVRERPDDYAAVYAAAQAALHGGQLDYAREAINRVHAHLSEVAPEALYHYALLNLEDSAKAMDALNQLLQARPEHAGARFLRGMLLGQSPNNARAARDDFLRLNDILRGVDAAADFPEIAFLHRYLHENDKLSIARQPVLQGSAAQTPLSELAGFDVGFDGYIVDLRLSADKRLLAEELAVADIVNLHFAYMLIQQDELAEAQSVMTGLLRGNPNSLAVQQMEGFLKIAQQEYDEAAAQFELLRAALPTDARTLNNFVTTEALRDGDAADFSRMAEHFDDLRPDESASDAVPAINAAYLNLLLGDADAAALLLADADSQLPQGRLNEALIAWSREEIEEAKTRLADIGADELSAVSRFLAAINEQQGDYEAALQTLDAARALLPDDQPESDEFALWRARLLYELGEWRLAWLQITRFLQAHPVNYQGIYYKGLLALRLNDAASFAEARDQLETVRLDADLSHFRYALAGARHLSEGDEESAAAEYYLAMQSVPSPIARLRYLLKWSEVNVAIDPAEVAQRLQPHQRTSGRPEIDALLAYALTQSDAARAAQYAAKVQNVQSYTANFYAGAAFAAIGDHQNAIPLLLAARREQFLRAAPLEYLKMAYLAAGNAQAADDSDATLQYLQLLAAGEDPAPKPAFRVFITSDNPDIKKATRSVLAGDLTSYDAAARAYEAALIKIEEPAKRAETLFSQATFETFVKSYDKAIALFERALALGLSPDVQLRALLFYSEVLLQERRFADSADIVRQVMQIDGRKLTYEKMLIGALVQDNKQEEAEEALVTLLARYPGEADLYYQLALIYVGQQRYPEGIATLRRLVQVAPNFALAYRMYAEIYAVQGDTRRAQSYSDIHRALSG